jgi:COP9 signalosome complex subunit 8
MLSTGFLFSYADVMQQGWVVDPASRMLIVKRQPVSTEQKLDPSKLQRLTEYVLHLEH